MPSTAAVSWTDHYFTHRIDKENKKSSVLTVDLELKNTLCWYWFLQSCSCDMFPYCHRACTVQHPSGFGSPERSCCEGPQSCWWCGRIWFVQARQQGSKTVVKHGGPVVLSGVTQEQDGLLAGSRHIAPQPLSAPADSPLYPEVLFHTEQGAWTGWNNEQYNNLM